MADQDVTKLDELTLEFVGRILGVPNSRFSPDDLSRHNLKRLRRM
jgi:hypothetical protein